MSDPRDLHDLYEELWSMEYHISGDKPAAKAFALAFLDQHAQIIADELRTRFPVGERARSEWADGWLSAADYIARKGQL